MITAQQAFIKTLGIDEDTYNAKMENVHSEINKHINLAAMAGVMAVKVDVSEIISKVFDVANRPLPMWLRSDIESFICCNGYKVIDTSMMSSGTLFHISWG